MAYFFGILALVIGIASGLMLPDVDLKLNFLVHRSLLTHSMLAPIILFGVASINKHATTRLLAMGVSLSTTIHLCFDLFPKEWIGFALIHVPIWGRMNPTLSQAWIVANIIGCLYLAFLLINHTFDLTLLITSLVVTFAVYAIKESAFWFPLVTLGITTGIVLFLPSNRNPQTKYLTDQRFTTRNQ